MASPGSLFLPALFSGFHILYLNRWVGFMMGRISKSLFAFSFWEVTEMSLGPVKGRGDIAWLGHIPGVKGSYIGVRTVATFVGARCCTQTDSLLFALLLQNL